MTNQILTHGCEHELADWKADELEDRLPDFDRDRKDITIVNSNGVANDPKLKFYKYGGEINTPPTDGISGQVDHLSNIKGKFPEVSINYRSNLHWHIGVEGLKEDLNQLKRFARYNYYWLPIVLDWVEPIPKPAPEEGTGAMRRWRRRKRSHHTTLSEDRVKRQYQALTVEEFFAREVPSSNRGQPLWHLQPRAAVNLRQLLQTNTIEFRHFPGTLSTYKLLLVGAWCEAYTRCALSHWGEPKDLDPRAAFIGMGGQQEHLPTFPPYDHKLEIRYRATCHDGSLSKDQIAENIQAILNGSFDEEYWESHFKW